MNTEKGYIKVIKKQYNSSKKIFSLSRNLIKEIKSLFGSQDSYIMYNLIIISALFCVTIIILGLFSFILQIFNMISLIIRFGFTNFIWMLITFCLVTYIISYNFKQPHTIIYREFNVVQNHFKDEIITDYFNDSNNKFEIIKKD